MPPRQNPNDLDAFGAFSRPVNTAASQCVTVFFRRIFPQTLENRYPVEEARDLEEDLRVLFADYAAALLRAEYARLRDDSIAQQRMRSTKEGFGPQHNYYERQFESDSDDEDDDDDDDDADEDKSEDLDETAAADEAEAAAEDDDDDDDEEDFIVEDDDDEDAIQVVSE
jgi:hypothetical protein